MTRPDGLLQEAAALLLLTGRGPAPSARRRAKVRFYPAIAPEN